MAVALTAFSSCTQKSPENTSASPAEKAAALADQGRRVYQANCTSCHNSDPSKDGVIGPAVAGSSFELVRARVLDASYPPGYKPKRETKAMAALPHLKGEIEALSSYFAASK